MAAERVAYVMTQPGARLERRIDPVPVPKAGEVVVEVAGCGLCHTDIGFLHEGVKTRKGVPIVLGHEIAGTVVAAGTGATLAPGTQVIVPAVMPCGECVFCKRGRENACSSQIMPGNDADGGLASHVVVPARFLCPVHVPPGELWMYGVVADAVATAYQAFHRARVGPGDVCIVVGAGGVGGFGVQIGAARGAFVIGIDVDEARLAALAPFGLGAGVSARGKDGRQIRDEVRAVLKQHKLPSSFHKIFETSGRPEGQEIALALLGPAALLSVVGYTAEKVPVRLSAFMAFDARLIGTWGCRPQLFPEIVALIREGKLHLGPFVERVPLDDVNAVIDDVRAHRRTLRPVLVPHARAKETP